MNKNLLKILSISTLFVVGSTTFQSCNKDDDDENSVEELLENDEKNNVEKIFFLNEGKSGNNNSTLDLYLPENEENNYIKKVFVSANGEGIGDIGQDMISYGDRIYLSVNGSNYIAKLDKNGKVLERYSFTGDKGQPRFLVADDKNIYVTLWSGQVAKFDTTSIAEPVAFVEVGLHPEEMTVKDGKLYAAIAGDYNVAYDNKIAVVDLSNFTLLEKIEVPEDPISVVAMNNNLFVIHYNTTTWQQEVVKVDLSDNSYEILCAGSKIASDGDNLFVINSTTDWTTSETSTSIEVYNSNGAKSEFFDFSASSDVTTSIVYMFEYDHITGDYYIGITDYDSNGTIFRFNKNGKFVAKFETSGINPNHAVFLK